MLPEADQGGPFDIDLEYPLPFRLVGPRHVVAGAPPAAIADAAGGPQGTGGESVFDVGGGGQIDCV